MDVFGIGYAVKGVLEVFFRSSRRSGRTTAIVEMVDDKTVVIFRNGEEARHFQRMYADAYRKEVRIDVVPAREFNRIHELTRRHNGWKIVFDHTWLEDYYLHVLEDAGSVINRIEARPEPPRNDVAERMYATW